MLLQQPVGSEIDEAVEASQAQRKRLLLLQFFELLLLA
jgi:hypothetical protein